MTDGSMTIGAPFFVGPSTAAPAKIDCLDAATLRKETRKQDAMDAIGRRVAALLPPEMRGVYSDGIP